MDSAERTAGQGSPLHVLAETAGEAGLRTRWRDETAAAPAPDRVRWDRALALAGHLHDADRWGDQPYVNHLLRVAIRLRSEYDVRDPAVLCAALLHDSVEDHAWRLARTMELAAPAGWAVPAAPQPPPDRAGLLTAATVALNRLAGWFGAPVADLVEAVTNPPPDPGRDRHLQYRDHLLVSLRANPWARVVKASDFVDNAGTIQPSAGPRARRTAEKYRTVAPLLCDLVALPDTPLAGAARARVLTELTTVTRRLDRLLA